MEVAYDTLLARPLASASEDSPGVFSSKSALVAKDGLVHPKVVSLGGDHTIVLPILRSLYKIYGPVSVIHFDSHMDTSGTRNAPPSPVTHGSYFFVAHEEGLLINNTNVHAGIRSKMNVSMNSSRRLVLFLTRQWVRIHCGVYRVKLSRPTSTSAS